MRIILIVLFVIMFATIGQTYGPTKNTISFSLTVGPSFTWSTFTEQEDVFTKEMGFYIYKTDPITGVKDSQTLRYNYSDFSGQACLIYYLSYSYGAGLFYRYGQISQNEKTQNWNISKCLLSLHRAGIAIQYWPEFVNDFNFSFLIPAGITFGELNRLAVLKGTYQNRDDMYYFIETANKSVLCNGIFSGISCSISHDVTSVISAALIIDYEWIWVSLTGDKIGGYPKNSFSNELGIKLGIILLTSQTGQRKIF